MSGKYGLVELKERYKEIQLPEIIPVDIKGVAQRNRMNGPHPLLLQYVREGTGAERTGYSVPEPQGFAPMIECHTHCGWVPQM